MPEFILQNASGMTTVVFSEGDKNQFLSQGYKLVTDTLTPPKTITGNSLKINQATIKSLTEIPSVTRAIAKQINDNKPYKNLEELIAIAPNVNWMSYQIDFEE